MNQLVSRPLLLLCLLAGILPRPTLHAQDSLRAAWMADEPTLIKSNDPSVDLSAFAWSSDLKLPLPDVEEQGWLVASVRTDAQGRFMGNCFALQTNSLMDQWFLRNLKSTQFKNQDGTPLEGWTVIRYGYCLPCETSQIDALLHTPLDASRPVNSAYNPAADEFIPALQEVQPLDFHKAMEQVKYPPNLKESRVEGVVYVKVLVDHFGQYKKHIVLRSAHPLFTKAVEATLKDFHFLPSIYRDGRGSAWIILPFRFRLN